MPKESKQYSFVVEGTGEFPTDMLRYDSAVPATNADQTVINAKYLDEKTHDVLWEGTKLRKNRVTLLTTNPNAPTYGRWKSHTWKVVEGNTPVTKKFMIAVLNDQFRRSLGIGGNGQFVVTRSVSLLPEKIQAEALRKMRDFDAFGKDNDPYGEHDFGNFEVENHKFFFKFDYYAPDMLHGSEDPTDPHKTRRVLTLMLTEDY